MVGEGEKLATGTPTVVVISPVTVPPLTFTSVAVNTSALLFESGGGHTVAVGEAVQCFCEGGAAGTDDLDASGKRGKRYLCLLSVATDLQPKPQKFKKYFYVDLINPAAGAI